MKRSTSQLKSGRHFARLRIKLRTVREGRASSGAALAVLRVLLLLPLAGMTPVGANAQTVSKDSSLCSVEAQEAKTVKAVSGVAATPDDSLCTVRWDGWPKATTNAAATGYEIRWGKDGEGFTHTVATGYRVYQAQPLDPGASYALQIRAIDRWGRASAWSQNIALKADSTRVDIIRKQCSVPGGFFDDFNLPEGKPDPLKWNFAVNRYTDPDVSAFAVNGQNHAHIAIQSAIWDRSQSVARPRQMFDLSDGGTRNVFIDFDSNPETRNTWYLDFIPESDTERDITSREAESDVAGAGNAPFMLRLSQSGDGAAVELSGADGKLSKLADSHRGDIAPAVVNVRRPYKFTISKTLVEGFLYSFEQGGYIKILSAPLPAPLPWDRARVFNTVFLYNGPKVGQVAWLWHWDNFAFDAPASDGTGSVTGKSDPITYDYRTQLRYGAEFGLTHSVRIPDDVFSAAWSHRLFFTVSPTNANAINSFSAAQQSKMSVTVNGRALPFSVPRNNNRSLAIDLPAGLLKPGDNDLKFYLGPTTSSAWRDGAVMNVHIEAQYGGIDPPPPYSDHCAIWGCPGGMGMRTYPVGPNFVIDQLGTFQTYRWGPGLYWYQKPPIGQVSGNVMVLTSVLQGVALSANGSASRAKRIDILVDKAVVQTIDFSGGDVGYVVAGRYAFTLDTTNLANGTHEVYVRAVSPEGWESIPNYLEGDHQSKTLSGDFGVGYHPVVFTVKN